VEEEVVRHLLMSSILVRMLEAVLMDDLHLLFLLQLQQQLLNLLALLMAPLGETQEG
jgi:hypothetical protein